MVLNRPIYVLILTLSKCTIITTEMSLALLPFRTRIYIFARDFQKLVQTPSICQPYTIFPHGAISKQQHQAAPSSLTAPSVPSSAERIHSHPPKTKMKVKLIAYYISQNICIFVLCFAGPVDMRKRMVWHFMNLFPCFPLKQRFCHRPLPPSPLGPLRGKFCFSLLCFGCFFAIVLVYGPTVHVSG